MKYINFDESRKLDLILLGRVAIDFNPAYSEEVKEEFKPLKKVHYFEKFVGGSPANIAVDARKGFGGGDGYGSGFLYGLYQGWEIIDCLEFGSAEASMMVRSNNCSDSLPGPEAVNEFIRGGKEKFGEMIARV